MLKRTRRLRAGVVCFGFSLCQLEFVLVFFVLIGLFVLSLLHEGRACFRNAPYDRRYFVVRRTFEGT